MPIKEEIKKSVPNVNPTSATKSPTEVKPSTIAKTPLVTKTPMTPPAKRKIKLDYKFVGRETITEMIKKAFPRQLIPSNRVASYLGTIFLLIIIIGFMQTPFEGFMSGKVDITIKLGYPMSFFELDLSHPEELPLKTWGLILDTFLYLFLAYLIDIVVNVAIDSSIFKSSKEKKSLPKAFKDKDKTIAERVTEKIIEKTNQKVIPAGEAGKIIPKKEVTPVTPNKIPSNLPLKNPTKTPPANLK